MDKEIGTLNGSEGEQHFL